ncbi:MAG: hypothetical protein LH473_01535 [Chitinophagales bacterium]|nr:hypothetical protein [Chitinophagales bacterium]
MKSIYVSLSLLMTVHVLYSQDYHSRMYQSNADYNQIKVQTDQYFKDHPLPNQSEGDEYDDYQRWQNFWEQRINRSNGAAGRFDHISAALRDFILNRESYCSTNAAYFQGDWLSLGPAYLADQGLGMITSVWAENENHLLAGSSSGGLWETTDGGTNWSCLTNDLPAMGIEAIDVSPLDGDDIWIGTSIQDQGRGGYGVGICYSLDGGPWIIDENFITLMSSLNVWLPKVGQLKFKPGSDVIIATSGNKIFRKETDGTWSLKYTSSTNLYESLDDIEFDPADITHNTIYVTGGDGNGNGGGAEIIKSVDGGLTWSLVAIPLGDENVLQQTNGSSNYGEFNNLFSSLPLPNGICNNVSNTSTYYYGAATGAAQWYREGTFGDYHAEIKPVFGNAFQLLVQPLNGALVMDGNTWTISFTCTQPANTNLELWLTEDYYPQTAFSGADCDGDDLLIWSSSAAINNSVSTVTVTIPSFGNNLYATKYYNRLVFRASATAINSSAITIDHLAAVSQTIEKANLSFDNSGNIYCFYTSTGGKLYISKSTNGGGSWSLLSSTPAGFCYNCIGATVAPGRNRLEFEVSKQNSQLMYAGGNEVWYSMDGGSSFIKISAYSGSPTHADIRALALFTSTGDELTDVLFAGNDGGIAKKKTGDLNFSNINGTGLSITQYYGLGQTEYNPQLITGGAQDNGIHSSIHTGNLEWYRAESVNDGFDTEFDRYYQYGDQYSLSQQSGGGAPTGLKRWSHIDGTPSSNPIEAAGLDQTIAHPQLASKKMFVHPKSGRLYVGYEDLYFSDAWRSATMNATLRTDIPTSIPEVVGHKIVAFDINLKDETRKYVAYDKMDGDFALVKYNPTTLQWENITHGINLTLPTANYPITDVTTDPMNADHLWVTFSGFNVDWTTGEPVV